MIVDNDKDLVGLMAIGRICGLTIKHMAEQMEPGMTTRELDDIGAAFLAQHGARSAPIITYNFPGATCISINEEVAHGIPGDRVIQPGDIVNIDVSAELDGYYGDTGSSFIVPPSTPEKEHLLEHTKEALQKAIDAVQAGKPLNVIGKAVETVSRKSGYKIIKELNGHGVGRSLHETPRNIPNYYNPRARQKMEDGLVLTIEPFFNTGKAKIITAADGWTLKTTDGSLSAQFEHTVIITKDKAIIVTAV